MLLKDKIETDYFKKLASVESGNNPNAKAKTSSATGLYQFTDSTWEGINRKYKLGYTLNDRKDPEKAEKVVRLFTKENEDIIKPIIGRDVTNADRYLTHFLGVGGASNFFKAQKENPNTPVSQFISPTALQANRSIFYNKDGTVKTANQLYEWSANKIGSNTPIYDSQVAPYVTPEVTNLPEKEEKPKFTAEELEAQRILAERQQQVDALDELFAGQEEQIQKMYSEPQQQAQQPQLEDLNETYAGISNFVESPLFQQGGKIDQFKKKAFQLQDERQQTVIESTGTKKAKIADPNARNKTDKEIAAERQASIDASVVAQKNKFTKDNWRQQLAAETAATGDKLRVSLEPNFFDDYINPAAMIGNMASNLGQAPLQAQQSDSVLPYVTSIGTPLAAGVFAGIGTNSTGQFVNNVINPLAGAERVIPYNKLYNHLPNRLNPNLLNANDGESWIKNWYGHPETKIRASAYENLNPEATFSLSGSEKINMAKQELEKYKDKDYIDLLNDKGLPTYLKNSTSTRGLSYGVPDGIYVKSQPMFGLNTVGRQSTKVHELTHLAENNGRIFNSKENNSLLEPFGYDESIYMSEKTPLEILGSRDKAYYVQPTEIHARMNEARYNLNLKPDDVFTENDFNTVQNGNNWFGMGKYIKDKDKFIKLMNNFYSGAAITGGAYQASKKQQGGIVDLMGQYKFPGEITIIPSSNITMRGLEYDIFGIDNLGNVKLMKPDQSYNFPGNVVTEYPLKKDAATLKKLAKNKKA